MKTICRILIAALLAAQPLHALAEDLPTAPTLTTQEIVALDLRGELGYRPPSAACPEFTCQTVDTMAYAEGGGDGDGGLSTTAWIAIAVVIVLLVTVGGGGGGGGGGGY